MQQKCVQDAILIRSERWDTSPQIFQPSPLSDSHAAASNVAVCGLLHCARTAPAQVVCGVHSSCQHGQHLLADLIHHPDSMQADVQQKGLCPWSFQPRTLQQTVRVDVRELGCHCFGAHSMSPRLMPVEHVHPAHLSDLVQFSWVGRLAVGSPVMQLPCKFCYCVL